MKNLINSLFARFGFAPVFQIANFRKAEKNFAELISLEQQAVSFVQNTLKVINNAVKNELKRNGYDPADVLNGKLRLSAIATTSEQDERFKSQTYSVDGYVILKVKWKPNGFTMEVNTAEQTTANKKAMKSGENKKRDFSKLKAKEKDEVEVEALTNKKINKKKHFKSV
jgi:hypothetical protein